MSCLLRHAFMHKNSTSNTWQGVVRCLGLTPSRTLAAPVIRKPLLRVKKIYSLQMNSVFVKFHVNVHHIVTLYTLACHPSGHCKAGSNSGSAAPARSHSHISATSALASPLDPSAPSVSLQPQPTATSAPRQLFHSRLNHFRTRSFII